MIEQEIVTKLEDMDVGSYTVARVMKDEHFCVELHYDARQNYAWVEIMTRTAEDCWNGYDEDAPWFRTDMFDDEILDELYEIYKECFSAITNDDYYRFTQGVNFDGHEVPGEDNRLKVNEALCKVSDFAMDDVKINQFIEVDFEGDGSQIWHYQVVRKDKKNNRLIVWLI